MSIDLSPLTAAVIFFIQSAFAKIPLGLAVLGVPAALLIGLVLASKLARIVAAQFGLGGGTSKVSNGGSSMKLVSSGKARVGRPDPLASSNRPVDFETAFEGVRFEAQVEAAIEDGRKLQRAEDRRIDKGFAEVDSVLKKEHLNKGRRRNRRR